MSALLNKAISAVKWSAVEVAVRQGLQFSVVIILARLLTPEDFGIVAILGVFVGLAGIFTDGGFSSAIIQKKNTSVEDESTVFFFNVAMGLFIAGILLLFANRIAVFFHHSVLEPLIHVAASTLVVSSVGSIHNTLLTKELNFRLITIVSTLAAFVSSIIAIVLAFYGWGVWAIAIQMFVAALISTICLWILHPWRPVRKFSLQSLQVFFRFGGYMMVVGLFDNLYKNLYSVLLGKFYSAKDVGFYDRAQKTQLIPVNFLMAIVNRVAYPVFSKTSDHADLMRIGFVKAQKMVMFINVPILVGLIVFAKPITYLLFGQQWEDCVPIIQILGVSGIFWPMHTLNLNILQAQGRSDLFFKMMFLKKTIAIGLSILACGYGSLTLATAQVVASIFSLFVNTHYSKKYLQYGILDQIRDVVPFLVAAIFVGIGLHFINTYLANDWIYCLVLLPIGYLLYLFLLSIFNFNLMGDLLSLMRQKNYQSTLSSYD